MSAQPEKPSDLALAIESGDELLYEHALRARGTSLSQTDAQHKAHHDTEKPNQKEAD